MTGVGIVFIKELHLGVDYEKCGSVSYTHLDVYKRQVLSYAQFGQVALKFFEKRRNKKYHIDGERADFENQVHPV